MWPFQSSPKEATSTPIFFTNTLSGKKELFVSRKAGIATLYTCGPTVYSKAHIGNMRTYISADFVARTLISSGYEVRRAINITDVGHLVSDADEGDDKIELGAKHEGLSAEDISNRYAKMFIEDIGLLNLNTDTVLFPRATHYIKEQIALVQELEKKGFTYRTKDGIYFDTAKYPDYGKLGGIPREFIQEGSVDSLETRINLSAHASHATRPRIKENQEKHSGADFALWKFSPTGSNRQQEWSSPWGRGFPGWHIECSAMTKALLGTEIDIHTGAIDLIPIHHNNELAQSEAVSGRPLANYWMHGAFLTMNEEKASKSLGNVVYLSDITTRGYHPLALRYFFLQAHYRTSLSFSWETLDASAEALARLWRKCSEIHKEAKGLTIPSEQRNELIAYLHDDLGTPRALALLWETLKDETISAKAQLGVILAADKVFGLSLCNPPESALGLSVEEIPQNVQELLVARASARLEKDYARADEIRVKIETCGYRVDDGPSGAVLTKSHK
jgi:cysteinyl-tRNA synthetase